MQIFATSPCPIESANILYHNPVRARKMITESIQILSCVCYTHKMQIPLKKDGTQFKTPKSRINHPVVKWASQNLTNAKWLLTHVEHLYDTYKQNGGQSFLWVPNAIKTIRDNLSHITEAPSDFCNFAKADSKNLDFRHLPVHDAYKQFLEIQNT